MLRKKRERYCQVNAVEVNRCRAGRGQASSPESGGVSDSDLSPDFPTEAPDQWSDLGVKYRSHKFLTHAAGWIRRAIVRGKSSQRIQ